MIDDKNLSTGLTQSELYSLTLSHIGLQSQRLKHLCEALISSDCHLTSLNISFNGLGDKGIMYLCNAQTSVNCTSLDNDVNRTVSFIRGLRFREVISKLLIYFLSCQFFVAKFEHSSGTKGCAGKVDYDTTHANV